MSVTLTVNGIPFDYPTEGSPAPWGEAATGWAEQVTTVINSLRGVADIIETGSDILNNQSTPVNLADMRFDPSIVRQFTINGAITRTYDSSLVYEEFEIKGIKKATGWDLRIQGQSDSGVRFSILDDGQVQYTSTNLPVVTTYSGLCKFNAVAILQA